MNVQCGYKDLADYVAAINIAARAVKQPIVADLVSSYKPPILIGGSWLEENANSQLGMFALSPSTSVGLV